MGKPFPTLLSSPWFIVIGRDRRLTLCASKLSADGFGNPPNARIEELAAGRSVVVGRTRPLPFLFLCYADAPRQDPSDENSEETRGGSSKFESSTCGVEMHACGGLLLPYLGRADKQAADILAGLGGGESQSTFDGHTVASDYGGA